MNIDREPNHPLAQRIPISGAVHLLYVLCASVVNRLS
jgi:hypothetical protein